MSLKYESTYGYLSNVDDIMFRERDDAKAHDLTVALAELGIASIDDIPLGGRSHKCISFLAAYLDDMKSERAYEALVARQKAAEAAKAEEATQIAAE